LDAVAVAYAIRDLHTSDDGPVRTCGVGYALVTGAGLPFVDERGLCPHLGR
jgi:hypothetical protein